MGTMHLMLMMASGLPERSQPRQPPKARPSLGFPNPSQGGHRSADSYVGTMYLMLMKASGPPERSSSASAAATSSPRHVASRWP